MTYNVLSGTLSLYTTTTSLYDKYYSCSVLGTFTWLTWLSHNKHELIDTFIETESIKCFFYLINNGVFLATCFLSEIKASVGHAQVMHVGLVMWIYPFVIGQFFA